MKKLITIAVFIFFGNIYVSSQGAHFHRYRTTWNGMWDNFEVMGGLGFTQFMGDAGGADQIGTNFLADFDFDALRPSFLLGARYRINHFIAVRLNFQYGILKGHDQYTSYPGRSFRNLGFKSPLVEWGGLVEFYFLPDAPTGHKKGHHHKRNTKGGKVITGYIATGVMGCYFNPLGDYIDGTTYELHLLHTEGQGILATRPDYALTSFVVPINLGFRYRLNSAITIDAELCYRKSFSDYMDDISQTYVDPSIFGGNAVASYFSNPVPGTPGTEPGAQRGDPTDPDGYMFLMFNVSWRFSTNTRSVPKYYN
jgi:hypothetical protein